MGDQLSTNIEVLNQSIFPKLSKFDLVNQNLQIFSKKRQVYYNKIAKINKLILMRNDAQGFQGNLCHFSFVCWFRKKPKLTETRKNNAMSLVHTFLK